MTVMLDVTPVTLGANAFSYTLKQFLDAGMQFENFTNQW